MTITHAVITAAGRGLKPYPDWDTPVKLLHPIIDVDGVAKPVLQILAQEAFSIGVQTLVLVVAPGDEDEYRRGLGTLVRTLGEMGDGANAQARAQAQAIAGLLERLRFVVQDRPRGYGHAVWCARDAVEGERFMLLLSDHLFLAGADRSCARQMVEASLAGFVAISSVFPMSEQHIHRYGIVSGAPVPGTDDRWRIERVVEKPTPTEAELHLEVPGLRRGHYLGFGGMHILPRMVFDWLGEAAAAQDPGAGLVEFSPVLDRLARSHRYLAVRFDGWHQNIGVPYGLWEVQLERALRGPDRDRILARLVQVMAADADRANHPGGR